MARKNKTNENNTSIKRIEDKKILSIQQLIQPFIGNNDHNRLQMVSSHLSQSLWLTNCEPPRIQSIFNKDMVKYSNMVVKAKDDMENLGTIKLQNEEFMLLKSEKELELYRIDTPILASAFTARHSYVNNNKNIKKGENILIKGNSDINENLQIGANALVGYMVYGDNFEDSVIVSESFSKKFTHVEKDIIDIIVNKNEYLLNFYGDNNNYKSLPDIGEEIDVNSRIICAKRAINNGWNSFVGLSKNSNESINFYENDTIYYNHGTITDISIYSNVDMDEEQLQTDFYKSISKYLDKNQNDIKTFLNLVDPYVKDYKNKDIDFTFGPNLQYYYNKFRKIDKDNVLTMNDKKFNGILIRITVEREVPTDVGSKISNTHGEHISI